MGRDRSIMSETIEKTISGDNPTLSILLPTYEYAEGLHDILAALRAFPPNEIEILISDDSESDRIRKVISNNKEFINIKYISNQPRLGAVKNWNALISEACADYIWLVHQDDCPVMSANEIKWLFQTLERNAAELIVLRNWVFFSNRGELRGPVPILFQRLINFFIPNIVLTLNYYGPPSVFIIKKSSTEKFDEALTWRVDCEFYYRLISKIKKICYSEINVVSFHGSRYQITEKLKSSIRATCRDEDEILFKSYPKKLIKSKVILAALAAAIRIFRMFGALSARRKKLRSAVKNSRKNIIPN